MKHGNSFYLQLTRELFTEEYKNLSNGAKWLFVVLNELEQRYTGKGCDFFYRTDEELAQDAGCSFNTFRKYKEELRDSGLVQMWNGHFVDKETGKKSKKKFSCYRILK